MPRSNDFALAMNAAHQEAGLSRISVAHILSRIAQEPGYLFDEEFSQRLAGQCPVHPDTRGEDHDKIVVNTTLAVLYQSLVAHIIRRMPLDEDGRLQLPSVEGAPYGLDCNDRAGLATAPVEHVCAVLRDATCHLLDALIREWAIGVLTEEERCRAAGEITTRAAASFVLAGRLESSPLYTPSGYDMLSLTKTGSHTALHVCWCLLESAPLLLPGRNGAFYDSLIRRSLKHIVPLSMSSLGMLVQFLDAGNMEAADHQATHVLPLDQRAFIIDPDDPESAIHLSLDPIAPVAKEGEKYYTGCPAFYTTGMIKLYMEVVLAVAADYGVYDRLQERGMAPAP